MFNIRHIILNRYIFEGESVYIVSIIDNSKTIIGEPYLHASKTKESNLIIIKQKLKEKKLNNMSAIS